MLNYVSLHKWKILGGLLALFTAIITPLIVSRIQEWLRHRKLEKARKRIAGIATEEELRKRVKNLPKEKKEKIESCFVPGLKELEAGKKLLQYGEEAKAKYHLEEAIKFFICAADALPCYETYYNLASAYEDYCDYENAKENFQRAIQHDPTQPGAYNGLGAVYFQTGSYPRAEKYYHKALTAAKKLTDQQEKLFWQANALGNLGNVYRETGQMEEALKRYQQALKIDQKIGNKLEEANALMGLGLFYADTGQMEQALERHQQALIIFRENGNRLEEAKALMNLGNVYINTGQTEQAQEHHQQALKIFREIGDKLGQANQLGNLGNVYYQTGQMEQALKHHQQDLKIQREIGHKLGEANALGNLGSFYADTGQIEQAREHYLLARAIYQDIGAPHLLKQTDENLAKLPGG